MVSDINRLKRENSSLRKELKQKEALGISMTEIAVGFVFPSKLDFAIDHALKQLLYWSGAERAIIMQVNPINEEIMGVTHEACRFGIIPIKRFAQNIPVMKYSYFEKTQRSQGYIAICNSKLLPDEAINEKTLYKKNKIGSAATCSFISRKKFNGFISLMNRHPVKGWSPDVIQFLRTITVLIEHSWERVETEKKLIMAKVHAEESDRMKTAFMANLSHEIRTPLNGILGFTSLMTNRNLPVEKLKHYSEIIEINSRQMLTIINDMMDISRIESGVLKFECEKVSINKLLFSIYEYFLNELSNRSDLVLRLVIPDKTVDYFVNTDPSRLKQVLDNLLKNAIRYTSKGEISLGYQVADDAIQLFVRDTGLGIDKKDLKNIFKRFWYHDSSVARPFSSNGLGLSITSDIIKLMGGEIFVNSDIGKGSEFMVELPLIQDQSEESQV